MVIAHSFNQIRLSHRLHFDVVDFPVSFEIDVHADTFRLRKEIDLLLRFEIDHFFYLDSHKHFKEKFAEIFFSHNLTEQVVVGQF